MSGIVSRTERFLLGSGTPDVSRHFCLVYSVMTTVHLVRAGHVSHLGTRNPAYCHKIFIDLAMHHKKLKSLLLGVRA